ncbi:MAG: hypothetical protein IJ776_09925 [Paludibacteraceae bacterium]|nr:hypothetical protein [Paludibacteraceae bacterium]
MKLKTVVILIFLQTCCAACLSAAQRVVSRSDKVRPQWVRHVPVSGIKGMSYRCVEIFTTDRNSITTLALEELPKQIDRKYLVTDHSDLSINERNYTSENGLRLERNDVLTTQIIVDGQPVEVRCRQIDSYWEYVDGGISSRAMYHAWVLFQVLDNRYQTHFENVTLTTSYGAHGLYSVLMPGAAQMYKGSYLKGGLMLGGSALLAGGVVLSHSVSLSYTNLENSTHNAQHKLTYHTKAQNYMVSRNVLIGALAALYAYNMVDAFVAPGARRIVKTGGHTIQYSVMPVVNEDLSPALAMKITF